MKKIYINGNILTMEDSAPEAEAIIVEHGKIVFVGSTKEALSLKKDHEVIDLKNKTMCPGFIDPHSHFVASSFMTTTVDLSSPPVGKVKSIKDIQDILKKSIRDKNLKPGKVLVGTSYDDSLFSEQRKMTKDDLDAVSTEHGIIIGHQSGHVGVCNSFILEKFKIDANTPDPEGGAYGRMPNSNEPNGQLEEKAYSNISQKSIDINPFKLKEMVQNAEKIYISNGITTAQEGGSIPITLFLARLANRFNWFNIDVVAYVQTTDVKSFEKLNKLKKYLTYNKHLRIGGVKFFLDGSPQAKTAWLSKPYHKHPKNQAEDYCGYPIYNDDTDVKNICKEAIARNLQTLTHCNGDQASEQLLNAYEAAKKELNHTKNLRPVMIHAQTVREDQLDRMAKLDMIPSFFNDHTYFWGDWHLDSVLGPERGRRISPMTSALKRNLLFTIHTDTPVLPPNLIYSMWCAVNRKTRSGRSIGEEFRISPLEALKAITINSAIQHSEEKTKGSIKEGKRADLVILDKNPLTIEPDQIKSIQVLETIKDGKTIYFGNKAY